MTDKQDRVAAFMEEPLRIVNIGLDGFAADLESQDIAVIRVDWSPPAGGDPKIADLLSKLES